MPKKTNVAKARTKFNVNKNPKDRTYDDIEFDSAMEMRYYRDVILPQMRSGQIIDFERQKVYELQPGFVHNGNKIQPINYKCDFEVTYADGTVEVIDIKGFADATALLKRKLFWYRFPDKKYSWLSFSKVDGGWISFENLKAARKERQKLRKKMKEEKENSNVEEG